MHDTPVTTPPPRLSNSTHLSFCRWLNVTHDTYLLTYTERLYICTVWLSLYICLNVCSYLCHVVCLFKLFNGTFLVLCRFYPRNAVEQVCESNVSGCLSGCPLWLVLYENGKIFPSWFLHHLIAHRYNSWRNSQGITPSEHLHVLF